MSCLLWIYCLPVSSDTQSGVQPYPMLQLPFFKQMKKKKKNIRYTNGF